MDRRKSTHDGACESALSLSDLGAILDAARKIIQGNYSVRQAEMLVSRFGKGGAKDEAESPEAVDPNVKAAIHALEQALGTKVTIQESQRKGKNRTALLLSGRNAPSLRRTDESSILRGGYMSLWRKSDEIVGIP